MPSQTIQWFPGHMAKTRRLISENLKEVDIIIELRDARIPVSSKNPEILKLCQGKPMLTLMNKSGLADPTVSKKWLDYAAEKGEHYIFTDCKSGAGIQNIMPEIRKILSDKLKRYEEKGISGKNVKAMILGIPNVGKSSLINRLGKGKKAKVENRPGVTLTKQWVFTDIGLDLMDMPGVLWPKFDDKTVGENLALTGAIKDAILDTTELSCILLERLQRMYPDLLVKRFSLGDIESVKEMPAYDLFECIARKRGMIISGGNINEERTSGMLLDEFRSTKIGRISLESPEYII